MKKSGILNFLSLFVAVLLIGGSLFTTGRFTSQKKLGDEIKPKEKVSTEGWSTCRDQENGYEFKYPAQWHVLSYRDDGGLIHDRCVGKNIMIGAIDMDEAQGSFPKFKGQIVHMEVYTKEGVEKVIENNYSGGGTNPAGTIYGLSKKNIRKIVEDFLNSPNKNHGIYVTTFSWWSKYGLEYEDSVFITNGKTYLFLSFKDTNRLSEQHQVFPPGIEDTVLSTFRFFEQDKNRLDFTKLGGKDYTYSDEEGKYENLKDEEKKLLRKILTDSSCIADFQSTACKENEKIIAVSSIESLRFGYALVSYPTVNSSRFYELYNFEEEKVISGSLYKNKIKNNNAIILFGSQYVSYYRVGMKNVRRILMADLPVERTYLKFGDSRDEVEASFVDEVKIKASVFDSRSESGVDGSFKKFGENILGLE